MSGLHEVQQAPTRVSTYHAPVTLREALNLLAADSTARPVAGGTDLILELERGARPEVGALVDLTRIPGLNTIEMVGDRVVVGALVTHNQVVASDLAVSSAGPLAQACLEVGSPQLRNRATVVGNLVTASPANDTISALLALDADVAISSTRGERTVALADFYPGFRTTALDPGELVTAVSFPALEADQRGVFVKLGLRRAQAISVVHLAMVLRFDRTRVTESRIALGSVAPVVVTAGGVSEQIDGHELTDEVISAAAEAAAATATPIDDIRAPAGYRNSTVAVMVERGLRALRDGTERATWPDQPPLLSSTGYIPTHAAPQRRIDSASEIAVEINGIGVSAAGAAGTTLLDWLREHAGLGAAGSLSGTKEGCAEGECGACTVQLDGSAVMSCVVPAARADGSSVTTIEGLARVDDLHPLQQSFIDCAAVQCGFCIPGFLVAGASLLDEIPDPDDDQIRLGLSGNLCRCTGYYKIIDAVHDAAGAGGS